MNIIPISNMALLQDSPLGNAAKTASDGLPFKNVLSQAIQNVEETNAQKELDTYNLAVGEVDNLAEIFMNTAKADTAMQMMVEVRNKLLDAYSEIMRLNV